MVPEFTSAPPYEEADVKSNVKDVGHDPVCSQEFNGVSVSDLNCNGKLSNIDRYLMFHSPETHKGTMIDVYSNCSSGDCCCSH